MSIQCNPKSAATYWPGPFFALWGSQALAMLTSEVLQFALIWWLTAAFNSATVVGIATMIALLPRALLGTLMGALVDRWSRQAVLLAGHGVIILSLLCLGYLFRVDGPPLAALYLIILARALGKSFQMPAMLASTALMAPKKHLSHIAGLNQMLQGIVLVASPALGAALVHSLRLPVIVAIDIAGALQAVAVLLFVALPNPPCAIPTSGWPSLWKEVRAGVRYVRDWPGAPTMLGISTAINFLFTPTFMLTSILVIRRFGGAEREFGIIGAAIGIGMIGGGMIMGVWGGFRRPMQTSLVGILGMASAILVAGLAPASAFWLAVGSMAVGGSMMPICMAPIQALVQKNVTPAMQGRVLSLFDSLSTAIAPLSVAIAGALFDSLGPQVWYVGAGLLAWLIGVKGFATPHVVNLGAPALSAE
ncbi:MAG: MFS transporter [Anaerolineae bacterium]|nr:MFS transporter [Anaerolineae bacterium]